MIFKDRGRKRSHDQMMGYLDKKCSGPFDFMSGNTTYNFRIPNPGYTRRDFKQKENPFKKRRIQVHSPMIPPYVPNSKQLGVLSPKTVAQNAGIKYQNFQTNQYLLPESKKKKFSEEDVRKILEQRDSMLRQLYNNIVMKRLQEQFRSFSEYINESIQSKYDPLKCPYIS